MSVKDVTELLERDDLVSGVDGEGEGEEEEEREEKETALSVSKLVLSPALTLALTLVLGTESTPEPASDPTPRATACPGRLSTQSSVTVSVRTTANRRVTTYSGE
ncbi:hypothetical protein [Natronoglomus mannanivorans]|uniref:Uncharacterized protein n=1 Tax=Natronoglomus mannanivorans TaxID=2979990 RepID=A0AAP3E178_9EURY|nr:hypothetical protein [Halobacteria archaeon AArc-xg1-1]